jgi:hypothetical protein
LAFFLQEIYQPAGIKSINLISVSYKNLQDDYIAAFKIIEAILGKMGEIF